jgi:PAS domain S-box-containing protein
MRARREERASSPALPVVASGAGLIVAALGLSVLLAWWRGFELWTSLMRGFPPMTPTAALLFLSCGLSLALVRLPPRWPRRLVGAGLALAPAGWALLILAEYATGADLGADLHLLLPAEAGPTLTRTAASTGFAVALLGAALALTHVGPPGDGRLGRALAEGLVLVAFLPPFVTLVGYLLGLAAPLAAVDPRGMPMNTAMALLILGVGVLLANPEGRVMERVLSPSAGGETARMLLPPVILVPLLLGALVVAGRRLGLFGESAGDALHAVTTVLSLATLTWLTSGRLQRLDRAREEALGGLRASEARFRALATASTQILWRVDPDGRPRDDSPSWREFTGQEREAWLAGRWDEVMHPDDAPRVAMEFKEATAKGVVVEMEYRLRRPDGSFTWTQAKAVPIFDEEGRAIEWIGTNADITRRKQDELALRAFTRRLEILTTMSRELAAAGLDAELVASAVVGALTDAVGDGCALFVVAAEGVLTPLSFAHRDRDAHELGRRLLLSERVMVGQGFAGRAVSEQRAIVESGALSALGEAAPAPEPYAELYRKIGLSAVLAVPLHGEKPRGAIMLVRGAGAEPFTDDDRILVDELAHRAGLALQNVDLYDQAQAAVRLRDDFLSVASHELRTPLTTLKLQVSAALSEMGKAGVADARLERFRRLDVQVERMTMLVNQLLDVARVSSGRLALDVDEVDLGRLTEEVVDWFKDQAARAHCEVLLTAEPRVVGRWDPNRIGQVIANLLSNALKYGAGKPVEVSVERVAGRARLVIEDHGIGVAPEDQARIFERFERAASVRNYGGLGLGLWISKQIVEKHGGSIAVASRPAAGARFVVELPLEGAAGQGAAERGGAP